MVDVDDEDLWQHRTEPVQVHLHVENVRRDIDDESPDQYEAGENELIDRREAAYQAALGINAPDAAADQILEDYDALLERIAATRRMDQLCRRSRRRDHRPA